MAGHKAVRLPRLARMDPGRRPHPHGLVRPLLASLPPTSIATRQPCPWCVLQECVLPFYTTASTPTFILSCVFVATQGHNENTNPPREWRPRSNNQKPALYAARSVPHVATHPP